ncbi:CDP-alcohol phosphatidyltransferase family protein [Thermopolyspora flexuosa]|jgi:phosphatidylglycerophosphate synthase|uniref:Phosphatidylglycerophosphate synthase n=1 Tax=Thermopolyspora flexuosa TaxID=103836 RepID=A0A543J0A9_9ACTN|nr:CDP-alcohol phosphatidyltransferase family protein [Thermopolyspora flexuosa]TQM76259.1 phosphatidylglycerophosphate synthase [Thermopolyspora flexuosa]
MTRVVLLGSSPRPIDSDIQPVSPVHIRLSSFPTAPTVTARLYGQMAALDPNPITIARPDEAKFYRQLPGRVVETTDIAEDLRALADAIEDTTESVLIMPTASVIHDELIYQINKTKRGALALIAKEPRPTESTEIAEGPEPGEEIADNGEPLTPEPPIEEAEPEICNRTFEGLPVRLRAGRSRVVSVGTAYHAVTRPNAVALGPLYVSAKNAPVLAEAARELAGLTHLLGPEDDLVQLLILCLVRRGVSVGIRGRRDLYYRRVFTQADADEAQQIMAGIDEDRVRLNNAVKGADGFFTTFFVSTYSRFIARWAARRGLTPNQVTLFSITLGVASAACFATGTRAGAVAGAVLIYFAFVFDCVDGQLARYARKFGVLGAWLDATFDRFKEYVVFAGLAIGATVAGQGDVWTLALAAIAMQSVRHLLDFAYGAGHRRRRKAPPPLPTLDLTVSADTPLREALVQRRIEQTNTIKKLLRLWTKAGRFRPLYWARKMIVFPIGERFAAIAITAAFFEPRITFLTLLIWGGIAAAYSLTGRLMRSLA